MVDGKMLGLSAGAAAYRAWESASGTGRTPRALLSHRFLFDEEPHAVTRDNLRRKLEWLAKSFTPIGVDDLVGVCNSGNFSERSLVYTTDDIHRDMFEVHALFKEFGVPLALFVPVGWILTTDPAETGFLVEVITLIQWHEGVEETIEFGPGHKLHLTDAKRLTNADWILENRDEFEPYFPEICEKVAALDGSHRRRHPEPDKCTWAELTQLHRDGAYIGSHSMSHVSIKAASPLRRRFELDESKALLAARFGECTTFAYPFGIWNTYDDATRVAVEDAGYSISFLTNSDVVRPSGNRFDVPRLFIPDEPVSVPEFKLRVQGAGIAHQKVKRFVNRRLARAG